MRLRRKRSRPIRSCRSRRNRALLSALWCEEKRRKSGSEERLQWSALEEVKSEKYIRKGAWDDRLEGGEVHGGFAPSRREGHFHFLPSVGICYEDRGDVGTYIRLHIACQHVSQTRRHPGPGIDVVSQLSVDRSPSPDPSPSGPSIDSVDYSLLVPHGHSRPLLPVPPLPPSSSYNCK